MSPLPRAASLLLALLLLAQVCAPARAQTSPQLIVTPSQGRPGDWFYISGGVFPTGRPLQVFMWCPDYFRTLYGHWAYELDPYRKQAPGYPTASLRQTGTFVGWKVQVPTPYFVKSTPCVLRAANGDNPMGVAVSFKILPADGPPASKKLPVSIRNVRSVAARGVVQVTVRSAPGGRVTTTMWTRSGKALHYSGTLPWNGRSRFRWRVGRSVSGNRLRMSVRVKLGDMTGEKTMMVLARS